MKKSIISSLLLLGCTLHAVESRVEIRTRQAGGVGYNTGYSSLDYFLMGEGESAEFLLDLRGHVFNDARAAGNGGLGFRVPFHDDKMMFGMNAFYDIRQAPDLVCHQIGVGLEWLTRYVDFRTNGYLPVGDNKKTHKFTEKKEFKTFSGSSVMVRHKLQASLPCIDAEVGTPLPRHFYFALGGYYLFEQESIKIEVGKAFGGRVRANYDWGRYISLGVEATYDHIFKTRVQGIFSINIPFEKKPCKPKKRNRCDPEPKERRNLRRTAIMRNEIIPIQDKKRTIPLVTGEKDDPITFLFVNNLAAPGGDGTIERPFAFLKDAEKASKPGDVIYVFPGDKTPRNMDEGIVLKEDQQLISSAMPHIIEGIFIPAQTPDIKPAITNITGETFYVSNQGKNRLHDFLFVPPWEYVNNKSVQNYLAPSEYTHRGEDPHTDALKEDFIVAEPERVPEGPASVNILEGRVREDYMAPPVNPPAPPASGVLGGVPVIDDYRG